MGEFEVSLDEVAAAAISGEVSNFHFVMAHAGQVADPGSHSLNGSLSSPVERTRVAFPERFS